MFSPSTMLVLGIEPGSLVRQQPPLPLAPSYLPSISYWLKAHLFINKEFSEFLMEISVFFSSSVDEWSDTWSAWKFWEPGKQLSGQKWLREVAQDVLGRLAAPVPPLWTGWVGVGLLFMVNFHCFQAPCVRYFSHCRHKCKARRGSFGFTNDENDR